MKKHITAFYLETLMLVAVFVGIILVLTGIFGRARAQSVQARQLTRAVALAENAAEALAAADSEQALAGLLAAQGAVEQQPGRISLAAGPDGTYTVDITWTPQGSVAAGHITVSCQGRELYALDTAVYTGEAG